MLCGILNLSSNILSEIILYPKMLAIALGPHPNSLIWIPQFVRLQSKDSVYSLEVLFAL